MSDGNVHISIRRGMNLAVEECLDRGLQFFHVSPTPELMPGRVVSKHYKSRPHYELFREPPRRQFARIARFPSDRRLEAAFEQVRQEVAAEAPSRKSAIFTFLCWECAVWFRDQAPERRGGTIFRFRPSQDSTIFVTDLIWRNVAANVLLRDGWRDPSFPFPAETQDEALNAVARAYWTGENPESLGLGSRPEALIDGEVVPERCDERRCSN